MSKDKSFAFLLKNEVNYLTFNSMYKYDFINLSNCDFDKESHKLFPGIFLSHSIKIINHKHLETSSGLCG